MVDFKSLCTFLLGCRGGWYWEVQDKGGSRGQGEIHFSGIKMKGVCPGLSLRGNGWGFPPATKNVAPGYFHRKKKRQKKKTKRGGGLKNEHRRHGFVGLSGGIP